MLLDERIAFKPTEYDVFQKYATLIRKTHWIHDELDFVNDVRQFNFSLDDKERYIIGTILKSFAQTETVVANDFWGYISNFIPKPEFKNMASANADNEWRHAEAYDKLSDVLNLTDYTTFLEDGILMERMENLTKIRTNHGGEPDIKDLARSFAIFGGFTEYVSLFSQFAILLSFSQRGLLADVGNIIAWSQKDEALHSMGAMATFNILMEEYPDKITRDDIKEEIHLGAQTVLEIEQKLIDQIFEKGELPNLRKSALVEFMKDRLNTSLKLMGYDPIFEVDTIILSEMNWFVAEYSGLEMADFFWSRPVEYTKGEVAYNKNSLF